MGREEIINHSRFLRVHPYHPPPTVFIQKGRGEQRDWGDTMAGRPHVTQKTDRRGRASVDIFAVAFDSTTWTGDTGPSFTISTNTPRETGPTRHLCEQAYSEALFEHGNTTIEVPRHVHLILSHRTTPQAPARIRFAHDQYPPDNPAVTWIYVLEADAAHHTILCVGGISRQDFVKTVMSFAGKSHTISRARCTPMGFYNTTDFDRESSLPGVPGALSSPHTSAMALSSSGAMTPPLEREGGAAAAAAAAAVPTTPWEDRYHPLLDYSGSLASSAVMTLCGRIAQLVPLQQLLRGRYTDMENMERFKRDMGGLSATHAGAYSNACSAAQVHGASTIALIDCVGTDDAGLQHAAHLVSHWLVRRYILDMLPKDNSTWQWFARREAELVTLHTRFAGDLARSLEPVVLHFGLTPVGPGTVPPEAVRAAKATPAAYASAWFTMDSVDALVAGIAALGSGTGARQAYISPATHLVFMSAEQVADDLLPLFLTACIRGEVTSPAKSVAITTTTADEGTAEQNDSVLLFDDDARPADANANVDDDVLLVAEATAILDERAAHVSGASQGFFLPQKDVDPKTLPHLDNASATRTMWPLCKQRLWNKLITTHRLEYGERLAYAAFLLDLGYSKDIIRAHMFRHFTKAGITQQQFDAWFANCVVYSEKNVWEDGTRTIPYDISCNRRIAATDLPGDTDRADASNMCVACPYARLSGETLSRELTASIPKTAGCAPRDIEDIVNTATVERNPAGACAKHFAMLYKRQPRQRWRPMAPRAFTRYALEPMRDVVGASAPRDS